MTQKLNKVQIQYVEAKLNKIGNEKLSKYDKTLPALPTLTDKLKAIFNGEVDLMSYDEYMARRSYYGTHYLVDAYDMSKFEKIEKEHNEKYNAYKNKIQTKIGNIMDSIILSGLDIEKAIKELEEM